MKPSILAFCLAVIPLGAATLTPAERTALLAQLDKSAKTFLDSLEGVSDAQWR